MIAVVLLALAATPREQYETLIKQYDAPLRVYHRDPERAKAVCQDFLRLARVNPGDPVAVEALHWVVSHTFLEDVGGEAMDLMARDHSRDERLGQICRELDSTVRVTPEKSLENLFRAVLGNNPNREVRAIACLALARRLKKDRDYFECRRLQNEAEAKGIPIDSVPKPRLTEAELAGLGRESQALYRRVIDEFGEIKHDGGPSGVAATTLGDAAKIERALSIGQVAPEIEGEDLDGKRFKLSDFRGKVVVLNFWNHEGCGICRDAYPEERALVKRMEGKPFVMLGINDGDKPETLRKLRETGEVTWRFWVDGEELSEAKILKNWNVDRWPTIVVLDRNGVIRYQSIVVSPVPLFEYAAETLMADRERAGEP
jgi:peroxiredoxin